MNGLVWFIGFYGISTFVGYFNAKSIFYVNNLFYLKTIQFSISTQFNCQKHLFQTIQVICKQFSQV